MTLRQLVAPVAFSAFLAGAVLGAGAVILPTAFAGAATADPSTAEHAAPRILRGPAREMRSRPSFGRLVAPRA